MISYTRELDKFCKVGVSQHLATHRLAAYTDPIDGDFFGACIYVDDPGCEAILETGCKLGWYGICFVQNDVW
jgi:hypothetical protein